MLNVVEKDCDQVSDLAVVGGKIANMRAVINGPK